VTELRRLRQQVSLILGAWLNLVADPLDDLDIAPFQSLHLLRVIGE